MQWRQGKSGRCTCDHTSLLGASKYEPICSWMTTAANSSIEIDVAGPCVGFADVFLYACARRGAQRAGWGRGREHRMNSRKAPGGTRWLGNFTLSQLQKPFTLKCSHIPRSPISDRCYNFPSTLFFYAYACLSIIFPGDSLSLRL